MWRTLRCFDDSAGYVVTQNIMSYGTHVSRLFDDQSLFVIRIFDFSKLHFDQLWHFQNSPIHRIVNFFVWFFQSRVFGLWSFGRNPKTGKSFVFSIAHVGNGSGCLGRTLSWSDHILLTLDKFLKFLEFLVCCFFLGLFLGNQILLTLILEP